MRRRGRRRVEATSRWATGKSPLRSGGFPAAVSRRSSRATRLLKHEPARPASLPRLLLPIIPLTTGCAGGNRHILKATLMSNPTPPQTHRTRPTFTKPLAMLLAVLGAALLISPAGAQQPAKKEQPAKAAAKGKADQTPVPAPGSLT